ncbi:hypothetical protein ACFV30_27450 [Streptomyces sp. NPDC059752]|uniref:hypothetical protein n=1 Tax=unclassified Streptomyces TaxID=2593676 RepID=UPI00364FAE4A
MPRPQGPSGTGGVRRNRSQQQTYTFYVPDNPSAKTTLGDITGDERVDFIASPSGDDLVVYPTAVDPSAGRTIASTKANSPGGAGWGDGTLTTHRGGNGIRIDDLWTWRDGQLKLYRNSLTQGGLAANGGLHYNSAKALPVTRPPKFTCSTASTGNPCGDEYAPNWGRVKQILAVGDARPVAGGCLYVLRQGRGAWYAGVWGGHAARVTSGVRDS